MEKESIILLAQLLQSMKEITERLEKDERKKNNDNVQIAKKEIIELQKQIDKLL